MSRALKLVRADAGDGTPTHTTMAEALADLCATVAAQQPAAVLIIWEPPGESTVEMAALPGSLALTKGLVDAAYKQLFPDESA